MISHSQGHRWRPLVIAMRPVPKRQEPRAMSPMKIVIDYLQAHERIEGWHRVW
jgi:hypothetical protein